MTEEVLVVGEALIDIVETVHGAVEHVGGSPANVAVGVARQGHPVRLLTRIGRDARGQRIAAHLDDADVVLDPASWSDGDTSTARARLAPDGSAQYEFAIEWSVAAPSPAATPRLIHTGSIAVFLEPGGTETRELLRAAVTGRSSSASGMPAPLVTLDPNIRPALMGDRESARLRFAQVAATAHLVKLSDEDAAWLYPDLGPARVLDEIASYGPTLVVMTRGAEGALGRSASGALVEAAPLTVDVADTIGAGDAFMASLISSALDEPAMFTSDDALAAALQRAAVVAGITVSRAGAQPPTRAEIDARRG